MGWRRQGTGGAAGRRYTRLMTSKADHHRPLPHRHSPFNPLSFIFKSPFCPSGPFKTPPPPLGSLRPTSSSFLSAVGAAVLPGSEETIHPKLFHPPDLSNFALFASFSVPLSVAGTERSDFGSVELSWPVLYCFTTCTMGKAAIKASKEEDTKLSLTISERSTEPCSFVHAHSF